MKQVVLDCNTIHSRVELHAALRDLLGLPVWYGRNLDALYDCLTELGEDTVLMLANSEMLEAVLDGYARSFVAVLKEAAEENPHFSVRL